MQEENRLKLYEDKIRKSQNESEYKKAVQKYYIKAQELNLWDHPEFPSTLEAYLEDQIKKEKEDETDSDSDDETGSETESEDDSDSEEELEKLRKELARLNPGRQQTPSGDVSPIQQQQTASPQYLVTTINEIRNDSGERIRVNIMDRNVEPGKRPRTILHSTTIPAGGVISDRYPLASVRQFGFPTVTARTLDSDRHETIYRPSGRSQRVNLRVAKNTEGGLTMHITHLITKE